MRNVRGQMVPMRSLAGLRIVTGPQVITRYNNYRAVTINGSPAPGVSSGDGLGAMATVSARTLPQGYAYEWTGTAYQEQLASGQTGVILALAVLFAYLFLVGLYESWVIPVPVLLSVTVGVLGSFVAILISGLALDLYAQIGLVVLIALTIAFALWITSLAGAVVGCLAVAGVYLLVAVAAVALALGGGAKARAAPAGEASDARRDEARAFDAQIDQFSAPLLRMLQNLGLKRELVAVLAGTSVAKRLGPLPLVGLAIVAGFLVGRMWKDWRGLFTSDAVMGLLGALGLYGGGDTADAGPAPQENGTA